MKDQPPTPTPSTPMPPTPPERREIPEKVLLISVAAAFGAADAVLVHRGGRPWPAAIAAGAIMAVFVFYGLRWFRQKRAARSAPPEPTAEGYTPPAAGGWANPRLGQKVRARLARLFRRPGSDVSNPLAGRGAPGGRGPERAGPPPRRDDSASR